MSLGLGLLAVLIFSMQHLARRSCGFVFVVSQSLLLLFVVVAVAVAASSVSRFLSGSEQVMVLVVRYPTDGRGSRRLCCP